MENSTVELETLIARASLEAKRVFLKSLENRPDYVGKIEALSLACHQHIKFNKPTTLADHPNLVKEAVYIHEHSMHAPQHWLRFSHLTGLREYCEYSIQRETVMYTPKQKEELAVKTADKANKKSLAHFVCAHHLTSIAEIVVTAAERAALDQGYRNSIAPILAEEKSASAKARRLHEFFVGLMSLHLAELVQDKVMDTRENNSTSKSTTELMPLQLMR